MVGAAQFGIGAVAAPLVGVLGTDALAMASVVVAASMVCALAVLLVTARTEPAGRGRVLNPPLGGPRTAWPCRPESHATPSASLPSTTQAHGPAPKLGDHGQDGHGLLYVGRPESRSRKRHARERDRRGIGPDLPDRRSSPQYSMTP